jgi:hypothetical protein
MFFNFVWLTGPGISGEIVLKEVSKGKYAGRVGRQNWKPLINFLIFFYVAKKSIPFPPTCIPHV